MSDRFSVWSDLFLIQCLGTAQDLKRIALQIGTEGDFKALNKNLDRDILAMEQECIARGIECEKL